VIVTCGLTKAQGNASKVEQVEVMIRAKQGRISSPEWSRNRESGKTLWEGLPKNLSGFDSKEKLRFLVVAEATGQHQRRLGRS